MVDVLVIGGGPNGLVAATRLAGAGRDVLLLERRDVLGGLAAGEEFHPGYRHAGVHHDTARFSARVEKELGLGEHGLAREAHRAPVLLAAEDGPGLLLAGDESLAGEEIARHSARDAERYVAWRAYLARVAPILAPLQSQAPPDALNPGFHTLLELGRSGLALRRLGKSQMLDLLRISPMCVADWLGEWFETELLKAGLALPAISGTWLGPWSPGTNMNLLLAEAGENAEVRGGGASVVSALEAAAQARGVTIRTGARVSGIRVGNGAVSGVELEDGEYIEAQSVLATCDPKQTLLQLVPPRELSRDAAHRAETFRARGTTAVVHLALSGPLEFAGRKGELIERARIGATLDDLERAFDGVKYGRMPARPALEVSVPSISSAGLAPAGGTVVSLLVHFVPFELEGGWSDERREELGTLALETLATQAPSVIQSLVAQETLTPADLAERYGTTGGHIHHGEHALDQLFLRPTPETARYRAPIPGLFLGGGGSHPGGGLTGLPGWLSAGAVLD